MLLSKQIKDFAQSKKLDVTLEPAVNNDCGAIHIWNNDDMIHSDCIYYQTHDGGAELETSTYDVELAEELPMRIEDLEDLKELLELIDAHNNKPEELIMKTANPIDLSTVRVDLTNLVGELDIEIVQESEEVPHGTLIKSTIDFSSEDYRLYEVMAYTDFTGIDFALVDTEELSELVADYKKLHDQMATDKTVDQSYEAIDVAQVMNENHDLQRKLEKLTMMLASKIADSL